MSTFSTLHDNNSDPIPLTVVFSAKRKRSIGMIVNKQGVTVRAPKRCAQRVVQQFIDAKEKRIIKQREKQQQQAEITTIEYDDNGIPLAIQHLGKQLPIYLRCHEKKRVGVLHEETSVTVLLPTAWMDQLQQYTDKIQHALEKRQRKQATDYLTLRTKVLNDELGLKVGNIIVKSYKRKYGQCKGREISLDWKLIRFPTKISDHIIYHELAHLTHKHHQKSFWNLLKTYDPGSPVHKKRLKEKGPAMHDDW